MVSHPHAGSAALLRGTPEAREAPEARALCGESRLCGLACTVNVFWWLYVPLMISKHEWEAREGRGQGWGRLGWVTWVELATHRCCCERWCKRARSIPSFMAFIYRVLGNRFLPFVLHKPRDGPGGLPYMDV
jgi:hypothetical protein